MKSPSLLDRAAKLVDEALGSLGQADHYLGIQGDLPHRKSLLRRLDILIHDVVDLSSYIELLAESERHQRQKARTNGRTA